MHNQLCVIVIIFVTEPISCYYYFHILNLIYFRPHYLALPAQSVECRLANIVPPGSTWPKRACKILVEMTKDKALYAFVTCTKVRHSL